METIHDLTIGKVAERLAKIRAELGADLSVASHNREFFVVVKTARGPRADSKSRDLSIAIDTALCKLETHER
jgi:hypothetical protein